MGRENKKRRSMKIKQAQKRRVKLGKLRQLYQEGKKDKEKILEKVNKIAPWLSEEEFLKSIEKTKASKSEGQEE